MKKVIIKSILTSVICLLACRLSAQDLRPKKDETTGKFGYVDETGKEIIPFIYSSAANFSEGLACVSIGFEFQKRYGYIDKSGNVVIPFKYRYQGGDFRQGLALVGGIYKKVNVLEKGKKYTVTYELGRKYLDKTGAYELCKRPLTSYIQQINNYYKDKKLHRKSRSSPSFKIERPYLVITCNESNKCRDIYINHYSEEIFNEHSVSGLKFLIIKYDYLSDWNRYTNTQYGNKSQGETVKSYGTRLIYFDGNFGDADPHFGDTDPLMVFLFKERKV